MLMVLMQEVERGNMAHVQDDRVDVRPRSLNRVSFYVAQATRSNCNGDFGFSGEDSHICNGRCYSKCWSHTLCKSH